MKKFFELLSSLEKESKNSKEDEKHFLLLMRLFDAGNYPAMLHSIELKRKQEVSTSLYQKSLPGLIPYFDIDSPFVQGHSPLVAAMKEKNEKYINLLLRYKFTLDHVEDIDMPLSDKGETALHIACNLASHALITMILAKKANPNIKNNAGETALHIACKKNNEDIALLLLNKLADPCEEFNPHTLIIPPFLSAIRHKNIKLVRAMLNNGYEVSDMDLRVAKMEDKTIYDFLKRPFSTKKTELIIYSNAVLFSQENRSLNAVFSRVFSLDDKLLADLKTRLEKIYHHPNPIMRPLLDMVALAAEGKFEQGLHLGKKLKIYLPKDNHIGELVPSGEKNAGFYDHKHSIYAAGFHGNKRLSLAAMLHEFKHFVDGQIYGDTSTPYRTSQLVHFNLVKKQLHDNSVRFMKERWNDADAIDRRMYQSIHAIFTDYQSGKQDAEILVKVPEIIGYLGVSKGYAWLEKNEPALLAFYKNRFNPACVAYMEQLRAEQGVTQESGKRKSVK